MTGTGVSDPIVQGGADIVDVADLKPGTILAGKVTNVTAFGAFVDVGVHRDGLVHISELAPSFVNDPHSVVSINARVRVKVLAVDVARNRISLSIRKPVRPPVESEGRDACPCHL